MLNNPDLNIGQNNRDYDCHNWIAQITYRTLWWHRWWAVRWCTVLVGNRGGRRGRHFDCCGRDGFWERWVVSRWGPHGGCRHSGEAVHRLLSPCPSQRHKRQDTVEQHSPGGENTRKLSLLTGNVQHNAEDAAHIMNHKYHCELYTHSQSLQFHTDSLCVLTVTAS